MQCLFKCMKNVSVKFVWGRSEFIGNKEVQLEKLQWFEGVQLFIISIHTYIYIYILYVYNSQQDSLLIKT